MQNMIRVDAAYGPSITVAIWMGNLIWADASYGHDAPWSFLNQSINVFCEYE